MSDLEVIQVPKRAYQACNRCRRRKARCVIGDPSPGAGIICLQCKRERKECIFTAERSEKAPRRRSQQPMKRASTDHKGDSRPPVGLGSGATLYNQASPSILPCGNTDEAGPATIGQLQEQSPLSDLTDRVTHTVVSNQADAINLLFEAAEVFHKNDASVGHEPGDPEPTEIRPVANSVHGESFHSPGCSRHWPVSMHPVVEPSKQCIKIFSKLKFVKKGWLTAQEAVTYVELFFRNMSPLSPVVGDFYGHPSNYLALVKEEPVLCTTVLTISSRYHLLHGDGWLSRSYFLHNRLWRYCQSLLQRVMWGQEKGATSATRGLGTVEGLLLMAEWHARSLHLPPDIEAWDSDDNNDDTTEDNEKNGSAQIRTRWMEGVVEPMRRSDRMSWSLIQTATSLAQELDIFDENKDNALSDLPHMANTEEPFTVDRRRRLRILLYVYVNRLAIRIGFASLIPHNLLDMSPSAMRQIPTPETDDNWFNFMWLWVDLTRIMRTSSDLLFPSKATTRDLVRSRGYRRILEHFKPMLESWWGKYLAVSAQGPLKELLAIDFMYTKIYIYSLALQAVAERKMNHTFTNNVSNEFLSSILDLNNGDYEFIRDLIDGAKGVLDRILGFSTNGSLKFLPVRIYVRVISACIFLLKALALGVRQDELKASLDLIDQTAWALRLHAVDDLHLAGVFASLLETYTQRFRRRFVTVAKVPGVGASMSRIYSQGGWPDETTNIGNASQTLNEIEMDKYWLAYPFDSSIAPFGAGITQGFCGFDDELNFIWNANM